MLQATQYLTETITLRFGTHVMITGAVAYDPTLKVLCFETDEDHEVLNVNLDSYGLVAPPGSIWIKDWSEHAGVADQLIELGAVGHITTVSVGPFDSPAHLVEIISNSH